MTEEWRDIQGFPGYQVSDHGNVRSWKNSTAHGRCAEPSLLRASRHGRGVPYRRVTLCLGGSRKIKMVHILVLEAFVGPRPAGNEARHVHNRDPSDNRLSNLAWGTKVENMEDQRRHGTLAKGLRSGAHTMPHRRPTGDRNGRRTGRGKQPNVLGERNGAAKIRAVDVVDIRRRRADGESMSSIASSHGITSSNVSAICLRKSWAHIESVSQ